MDSTTVGSAVGLLATATFVSASVIAIYAQASSYDQLTDQLKSALRTKHGLVEQRLTTYEKARRKQAARFYETARALWLFGLSLFALTLGSIGISHFHWVGYGCAGLAAWPALSLLFGADFRKRYRLIGLLALVGCGLFAFGLYSLPPLASSVAHT